MVERKLSDTYEVLLEEGIIDTQPGKFVSNNLNSRFELRPYQREAVCCFRHYLESDRRKRPTRLLYHMATGSGKTLIMAANILQLYKNGYRNFIFFVNNANILEKTKENFTNPRSSKYLFEERLEIFDNEVEVREVENFAATSGEDVNIHFTTIQGLHSTLHRPSENSLTYEDFDDKEIVLISDEAHHINVATKSKSQLTKTEKQEQNTWEHTVNRIFETNSENVLLEYTATANLDHPEIAKKYEDKILYQYSLKEFRRDGYSKEVQVLQADLRKERRALQAIILSQYRRKVAEKYGLHFKPVVMMKSRTISASEEFEKSFFDLINNLDQESLTGLRVQATGVLEEAFDFFEERDISYDNLVRELKTDFSRERCISVNSKSESEEKQVLVNSLEDRDNEVRVVFAVDKLNEGWDVLNLFDIVRLYDTRSTTKTVQEAQLIGRGARYYPFQLSDDQDLYRRKFDDDIGKDARILEELYYHSAHNPQYIQELKEALAESGIRASDDSTKEVQLEVKDSFKQSDFWKDGVIFLNEKRQNAREDIDRLKQVEVSERYKYTLHTGRSEYSGIFSDAESPRGEDRTTKDFDLLDLGENVVRKAIHRLDFYSFNNLTNYFPNLPSMSQFLTSDRYLSMITVEVTGTKTQLVKVHPRDRLEICLHVLDQVASDIREGAPEYEGSKEFQPTPISSAVEDKTRKITLNEQGDQERGRPMAQSKEGELKMDLSTRDWYVYNENFGTSQEKYFVKFLDDAIDRIEEDYSDIYLIRNEGLFKIYQFSTGDAFEPDFVMFVKEKRSQTPVLFQLFVEPKGQHLMKADQWKEDFLEEIESEYDLYTIHQNEKFRLAGLPFYNESLKDEFKSELEEMLSIPTLF